MGANAPSKLKSLLRHVRAQLGKDSTAEDIDSVLQKLENADVVKISGEVVTYKK